MKLIVGLGNPGKEYERTRHNAGFLVLDKLAGGETWSTSKKAQAEFVKTELDSKRVELLKPMTFMNNSGVSVVYAMKNHNLTPADIIVVHDDKDIPLGEFKIHKDRGAAGHNGVLSIIEHLGTKNFTRIRVGVAPNPLLSKEGLGLPATPASGLARRAGGGLPRIVDTADFVLAKFSKEEQKILHEVIERVIEEIGRLIKD